VRARLFRRISMAEKSPPVTASLGFGMKLPKGPNPEPARRARILLVDPDAESRRYMNTRLTSASYQVDSANGSQAALDFCVRSRPNLVISDLRLDQMDGIALLKELKSRWPTLVVIIITAHGTIAEAVRATQEGAFGFLVKPVEKAELLGQVERAIATSTFTLTEGDWRSKIVTRSQLMEDRLGLANKAASSDAPVLLTGENGTGKELLARAIHAASSRRNSPFVVLSCKDVAEDALANELFGPENAASPAPRGGALAAARGGTLMLDEIGDLSPRLQKRLMAVLRPPAISAEAWLTPPEGQARIISTTSHDLGQQMERGAFRSDLYYHINVLPIEIPPLGRRREDIPLLVSHFLEQATEVGDGKKLYSPQAIELLATSDWPGNVRQLFELVKQNVALSHGKIMSKEFVEKSLGRAAPKVPSYDEARESFARDYLTTNLQSTSGNVSQAARLAKRNRTDFYKLLARYRVEPEDFKQDRTDDRRKDDTD
jgi:two-component system response regulator GlrR